MRSRTRYRQITQAAEPFFVYFSIPRPGTQSLSHSWFGFFFNILHLHLHLILHLFLTVLVVLMLEHTADLLVGTAARLLEIFALSLVPVCLLQECLHIPTLHQSQEIFVTSRSALLRGFLSSSRVLQSIRHCKSLPRLQLGSWAGNGLIPLSPCMTVGRGEGGREDQNNSKLRQLILFCPSHFL